MYNFDALQVIAFILAIGMANTYIKWIVIYSMTVLGRYKTTKTDQSNKRKKEFKFRFQRAMAIHRRKKFQVKTISPLSLSVTVAFPSGTWHTC